MLIAKNSMSDPFLVHVSNFWFMQKLTFVALSPDT